MTSISHVRQDSATSSPAWAKAFAQPAEEFPLTPLSIRSGSLPVEISGTLYRNGPGRLERGNQSVGHWFDGDGAVLAIHLAQSRATATYRYVRTMGYEAEAKAGHYLYSNYGMTASGMLWERWGKPVKNAANTSVMVLPDRVLALWEGGNPHALDRKDVTTLGKDDLSGTLPNDLAYSAHPKVDPNTGDIYNFSVTPAPNSTLNLFRSDRTGTVQKHAKISLKGFPALHDFVMAGRYLVFFVPPVRINLLPIGLGLKPFCDAMSWYPKQGTEMIVIDRDTFAEVSRGEADAWFQWHFSNGYEEADGTVVIDVVRYVDFKTNQYLKEVATGHIHTPTKGTFWRLRINPQTGTVLSQDEMIGQSCEFPVVKPHQVGYNADAVFLNIQRPDADMSRELFGAIARFVPSTQRLTIADLGENRYPSEPIFAPHPSSPDQGWVLTVVYDGNTDSSELWIFDADGLERGPICRLGLPGVIPHSFHGTWSPQAH